MYRTLILVLIVFIFSNCIMFTVSSKPLAVIGDARLPETNILYSFQYIGFSDTETTKEIAFERAYSNAVRQIVNDLGVTVKVETDNRYTSLYDNQNVTEINIFEQSINIEGEHNISVKVNRFYIEEYENGFKAWVEIIFHKDDFFAFYENKWKAFLSKININSFKSLNSDFIVAYERFKNNFYDFEKEKHYLSSGLVDSVNNLDLEFKARYQNYLSELSVDKIKNNYKFPAEIILEFTYRGKSLDNLPVNVNNDFMFTNSKGRLMLDVRDFRYIKVFLGHNLVNLSAGVREVFYDTSFSPYYKENYAIKILSDNLILKQQFENFLRKENYLIRDESDIVIKLSESSETRLVAINRYYNVSDISIYIVNNSNINRKEKKIILESVKGYGKSVDESKSNSFSLKWYQNRNDFLHQLEEMIISILWK